MNKLKYKNKNAFIYSKEKAQSTNLQHFDQVIQ